MLHGKPKRIESEALKQEAALVASMTLEARVSTLMRLGETRQAATIIALLLGGPKTTAQLCQQGGLSQPAVSSAMGALIERGFVAAPSQVPRREGADPRGRLMNRYRLAIHASQVRRRFIAEAKAQWAGLKHGVYSL